MVEDNNNVVKFVPELFGLIDLIDQWGRKCNIIGGGSAQAQFVKLIEEFSEAVEGVTKGRRGDVAAIKDGIGDTVVVATMIAGIEGLTLTEPQSLKFGAGDFQQLLPKFMITFGKMGAAIARNNKDVLQTTLDDLMNYLNQLAETEEVSFAECIQIAYDEIKDRKGVLIDGIFIKSTDERYSDALARLGRTE